MWVVFENLEFRTDLESKKGNKYSAWIMSGIKKGWQEEEDSPYSKQFFDGTFVTVKDRKGEVEMDMKEFFEACEPGDTVVLENKKDGANWKVVSLENKNRSVLPDSMVPVSNSASPAMGAGSSLNAAVSFVGVLVANGHYKDNTPVDILLDAVSVYKMRLDSLDIDDAVASELDED